LLSLLIRADGRKVVERYLAEVFDEKIASPIDATIRYRVAAYLDSEEVNAAARRYEEKYGNGLWLHYSKRKGWPINDLFIDYDY
jgi:protoheme ferro-lyase